VLKYLPEYIAAKTSMTGRNKALVAAFQKLEAVICHNPQQSQSRVATAGEEIEYRWRSVQPFLYDMAAGPKTLSIFFRVIESDGTVEFLLASFD
jgi:hypothetical protein